MEVEMLDDAGTRKKKSKTGNRDVRKHSPFLSSHIMAKCLHRQLNQVLAVFSVICIMVMLVTFPFTRCTKRGLLALQTSSFLHCEAEAEIWRMWSGHLKVLSASSKEMFAPHDDDEKRKWRPFYLRWIAWSTFTQHKEAPSFMSTNPSDELKESASLSLSPAMDVCSCMCMSATTPSLIIVIKTRLWREKNESIHHVTHRVTAEQLVNLNLKSFIYVSGKRMTLICSGVSSPWNNTFVRTPFLDVRPFPC